MSSYNIHKAVFAHPKVSFSPIAAAETVLETSAETAEAPAEAAEPSEVTPPSKELEEDEEGAKEDQGDQGERENVQIRLITIIDDQ